MGRYAHLTREETELVQNFPTLSQEDLDSANDLFPHYIFYSTEKSGDRSIQSSCCHKAGRYDGTQRVTDDRHRNFMNARHNDPVFCPYCGKAATLKNIGKSRKRKKLLDDRCVVFLHTDGEAVFAQAYITRKDYTDSLDGEVAYCFDAIYHFTLGKAQRFDRHYGGDWRCVTEQGRISRMKIAEPFVYGCCVISHMPYSIIGLDRLSDSSLRYCQYDRWKTHPNTLHRDFAKYMTLYCVYPKPVEMLMKTGSWKFIAEFLHQRRKNAAVFSWEAETPQKAFGLPREEIKSFLAGSKEPKVLHYIKQLRKYGIRQSIAEMDELLACHGRDLLDRIVKHCPSATLRPQKIIAYLGKYVGGCHAGGYRPLSEIARHWNDYLNAATAIGYDLSQERVVLPKDLQRAHDTATAEHRRQLQAAQEQENTAHKKKIQMEYEKRREKLHKQYAMVSGGLFIRVPRGVEEIIAEGQALQHCVAGYAQRHMSGAVTILFLRRVEEADRPLCTIEMDNKTLVQIHGYKNEREHGKRIAPHPLEAFDSFLTPWMFWVQAGSHRDQNGTPLIPNKTIETEVQTA